MELGPALIFQVAQGLALAACAGMRAFLPLLVVGTAGRLEWIPLTSHFDWMASTPALIVFGVAVVAEVLADKVPVVDNVLDSLQIFVKPVAGTVLMASTVTDLDPVFSAVIAIVLGGSMAEFVHLGKAKARLLSTVATAGMANPVVSFVEDGTSLGGSVLAIFWPFVVLAMLFLFFGGSLYLLRYWRTRSPGTAEPSL